MKKLNSYDRLVCTAVKNDPLRFIDVLLDEATNPDIGHVEPLLREAACVITNLLYQLGEKVDWNAGQRP